jgi:hypothetical protein
MPNTGLLEEMHEANLVLHDPVPLGMHTFTRKSLSTVIRDNFDASKQSINAAQAVHQKLLLEFLLVRWVPCIATALVARLRS